ncbi:hypothetical protein CVT26_008490 [Gymnopilus dilepis]|uniref:Uncharacterized protein n=1 Tax=Gymnopilus dilepis TaxID=231916 RepID=A0A409WXF6_9AGAR|nr:hypothetical protein CVT26_008490 [Gymnopilus dilepis]
MRAADSAIQFKEEGDLNAEQHPFSPFQDRLAFDWAYYRYVRLQSSKSEILEGLDIWRATVVKHSCTDLTGDEVPWRNADELYKTIDAIQVGDAPWKCYQFSYTGPKPPTLPRWMTQTYKLNIRDILHVLEQQLETSDFCNQITYIPYQEYDALGNRAYPNLMSGDWAFRQADIIARNRELRGAMFVPVIAGSDKTTVSVATGHQEYHPVYTSPGIFTDTARRGYGNAILPVAFLPIPKGVHFIQKNKTYLTIERV